MSCICIYVRKKKKTCRKIPIARRYYIYCVCKYIIDTRIYRRNILYLSYLNHFVGIYVKIYQEKKELSVVI